MDDSTAQQQLYAGLAFGGKITASVTHELNNVLGTIEQVTGLIEDLADTDAVREAGISDRLLDVVERVTNQTDRGTELIRHLNGFAHLSDSAVTECDLRGLLELVIALSARFAKMRKVQLSTAVPDQSLRIRSSPFEVAQTIFGGIISAIQIAKPNEPIQIELVPCGNGGMLTIEVFSDSEDVDALESGTSNMSPNASSEFAVEAVRDGVHRIRVLLEENH